MSVIGRAFGRIIHVREMEARRQVQVYLRNANRDLIENSSFGSEMANARDPKYLPF